MSCPSWADLAVLADALLTVLRDCANTDILRFPTTPAHLANMIGGELNHVLRSLDLPVNDTIDSKRQTIGFYVGLTGMQQ